MNLAFASRNEYDIPDLLPSKMARQIDKPTHAWRGARSKLAENTTLWHFYTDERHFSSFKTKPAALESVASTPAYACVEPNFGMGEDTPRVIALQQIYWKRLCSRYWQTEGKHIVVDLHVPENFIQDNLIGVPRGSTAYATRGTYGDGYLRPSVDQIRARLDLDLQTARTHAETDEVEFVVYAGGVPARDWAKQNGAIHVPNWRGAEHQAT